MYEIPPEVGIGAAGAAGSGMALKWVEGGFKVKLFGLLSSFACAVASATFVSWYYGMTSVAGLALIAWCGGLLGMLIVQKVVEFIQAVNVGDLWQLVIEKIKAWIGVAK